MGAMVLTMLLLGIDRTTMTAAMMEGSLISPLPALQARPTTSMMSITCTVSMASTATNTLEDTIARQHSAVSSEPVAAEMNAVLRDSIAVIRGAVAAVDVTPTRMRWASHGHISRGRIRCRVVH
jgi:membrane-associated protease RseP (regulator of RpoE activity)